MKKIKTVSFIGAGNVATRLSMAFHGRGFEIKEIFSHSPDSARILAKRVGAKPVFRLSGMSTVSDLFIIAINDNDINRITSRLKVDRKPVVHTSGSTPMSILRPASDQYGVFYPLQTLQKSVDIDFSNIPICIEANSKLMEKLLVRFARSISSKVFIIDSEKRRMLHLAAIFACNFSNHMYAIAENLLKQTGLDFSILRPLIIETAGRAGEYLPSQVQTGPAARKDKKIISLHLQMLKNEPGLRKIYRLLSNHIMKTK